MGKALAEPGGEYNIYRRILEHAPMAAEGDWNGFAAGPGRPLVIGSFFFLFFFSFLFFFVFTRVVHLIHGGSDIGGERRL